MAAHTMSNITFTTRLGALKRLFSFSGRERACILAGGLGFWLGFPNDFIQIPPLALLLPLSMACLALEAQSTGKAVAGSMVMFVAGAFPVSYWLVYPMINYGSVPLPTALLFVLLLDFFVSIYYAAFAVLLRLFRSSFPTFVALAAGALTWGGMEYLRGWLFTGVSWASLSSAMMGWPLLAQGASLAGMYGLSALLAFTVFGFLPLLGIQAAPKGSINREGASADGKTSETGTAPCGGLVKLWPLQRLRAGVFAAGGKKAGCAVISCIVAALLLGYGAERVKRPFDEGARVIIAQAQGNIEQAQKWIPSRQEATVLHYARLSEQAARKAHEVYGQKPDLVVWPETAVPFYFQNAPTMGRPIRDLARRVDAPVLFGVPGKTFRLSGAETFNRVWLLSAEGMDAGYYDKQHLVPFGEYLPRGVYVPFAGAFLQGHGFSSGTSEKPLRYENFLFGILICYEGIFPELAQARVSAGANLLVNVSNDAWFADSPAPWQHLQLSAMRAVEQGRYMIRSTNTGASAMIDPAGRISEAGPLFESYYSAHEARLLEEKTFFNRNYGWISAVLAWSPLFFTILAGICTLRRKRRMIKS